MKKLLSLILVALSCVMARALELPDIIGHDMVLQQQSEVKLWGWAKKGAKVEVITSWDHQKYTAKADKKSGRWEMKVKTPEASYELHTVTITEGKTQVVLGSVLVGEVWFCSGQSNMEMPLRGFWNCPVEGAQEAIATCGKYRHAIRMATVPKVAADEPQTRVGGKWQQCKPEVAGEFSALGFFFARTLNQLLDVPVGIINCSWGGSTVEGWLPREILKTYPDGLVPFNEGDWMRKMVMHNGMLAPLAGYTVKGFLWNQGESNIGRHGMYAERFGDLVNYWRKLWGNQELPVYSVELPPYWYDDVEGSNGPDFRVIQHEIAHTLPHTGCVCTTDLCYPYEARQIHGTKKLEIGQRMAYMAAARDYGLSWIHAEAPELERVKVTEANPMDLSVIAGSRVAADANEQGKVVELYFSNSVDGFDRLSDIEGFEAADAEGQWYKATVWATSSWSDPDYQGCYLKLACPEAKEVKAVRYNYHNFTTTSLHNMWGLPVVPFITKIE